MQALTLIVASVLLGVAMASIPPKPFRTCREHQAEIDAAGTRPGAFRPQCDADGSYSAMQGWGSIGMSQCVDRLGNTIVPYQRGLRACECPRQRHQATTVGMPIGGRVPQCDQDGTFAAKQFHASSGYVTCVMPDNTPISGYNARGIVDCTCPRQAQTALSTHLMGAFVPSCNPSTGLYQARQTQEGYTFCVNTLTGEQVGPAVPHREVASLNCV